MSLRPKDDLLEDAEGGEPYQTVIVEVLIDIRDVLAVISKRLGMTTPPPPPKVGGA